MKHVAVVDDLAATRRALRHHLRPPGGEHAAVGRPDHAVDGVLDRFERRKALADLAPIVELDGRGDVEGEDRRQLAAARLQRVAGDLVHARGEIGDQEAGGGG